jgi:hypothetical protein
MGSDPEVTRGLPRNLRIFFDNRNKIGLGRSAARSARGSGTAASPAPCRRRGTSSGAVPWRELGERPLIPNGGERADLLLDRGAANGAAEVCLSPGSGSRRRPGASRRFSSSRARRCLRRAPSRSSERVNSLREGHAPKFGPTNPSPVGPWLLQPGGVNKKSKCFFRTIKKNPRKTKESV